MKDKIKKVMQIIRMHERINTIVGVESPKKIKKKDIFDSLYILFDIHSNEAEDLLNQMRMIGYIIEFEQGIIERV